MPVSDNEHGLFISGHKTHTAKSSSARICLIN